MNDTSGVPALRRALAQDAAAVAACVAAAYSPWIDQIGRTPWPMLQDYEAVVRDAHVVVAEQGGKLVGILVLRETAEGFLVDNVAVMPSHKGHGLGKALLVFAEQQARQQGHASLYLYTNARMQANITLYLKAGYVEFARRQEEGFERVYLRKVLA